MPAFRGKNLRSGDLAEQLGVFLLQSVALVTPVPRTEDIGIDVIATLIKEYDSRKYIAEDSFSVQIKSSSVDKIIFQDDEVKWLSDLHLPFFIGSVDRNKASIKLYSTHSLSEAFVDNPNRKMVIFNLLKNYEGDFAGSDDSTEIPIGPPVIEWSLARLDSNPNFIEEFSRIMKAHVTLAKKGSETRRIGFIEQATWKTGEIPNVYANKMKLKQQSEAADEISAPYFSTILNNIVIGEDIALIRTLYRLFEKKLDDMKQFHMVNGKRELKPYNASDLR